MQNNELLIELFTEDIPARLHKKAIEDSRLVFSKLLNEYGAEYQNIVTYISPRRLTIRVDQLNPQTKVITEIKRGPKIGTEDKAIEGFLNSNDKQQSDLEEKDGYYYLTVKQKGKDIKVILGDIIEDFILNMTWSKSMRWYLEMEQHLSAFWVRPMRSIICIYNYETLNLNISSVGITTSNYTYGHRFLSSNKLKVQDFKCYQDKLETEYVMLDFNKKKAYIEREMTQQAAAIGLLVKYDEELLDEVTGLVEYPFIHIGNIEERFMALPMEVLSTSMRVHQKYFTLTYPDSTIAPFFITVTNIPGNTIMYEGFERVLRARLSDAMFFYKEDTEVTLEAYVQRLSNIVFHEKLGTISQKVDRLMSIANTTEEHRVISLCKADLVTQMVGEFPELQGTMGEIYARAQGEDINITTPIREHYKPLGPNDSLPTTLTGARVSFFDKLDTLVGFLGVGIKPTGSKDPFALRRSALSIIRLICDSSHDVLDNTKLSWYIETLITSYADQGIALSPKTVENIGAFLMDRLATYVSDKLNIDNDICWQVIEAYNPIESDFRIIQNKIIKLNEYYKKPNFEIIKEAYKRAKGIIGENISCNTDNVSMLRFDNQYTITLQNNINLLKDKSYDFDILLNTSQSLLDTCDNVLINDSDINIKNNNLLLLAKYISIIDSELGRIV